MPHDILLDFEFIEKWAPRLPKKIREELLTDFKSVIEQKNADAVYELLEYSERNDT